MVCIQPSVICHIAATLVGSFEALVSPRWDPSVLILLGDSDYAFHSSGLTVLVPQNFLASGRALSELRHEKHSASTGLGQRRTNLWKLLERQAEGSRACACCHT